VCSAYWNLHAGWTCPACGHENTDAELQTHWMGEPGSCINRYRLGDPVAELAGITAATLPDAGDDFIGDCDECGLYVDFGGRIENGAVVEVWPYRFDMRQPDGTYRRVTVTR
jgi:hypothetical protein